MATAAELRKQCMEIIDTYRGGYFNDRPWLREAFDAIPRERFTPDRVWWHLRDDSGCYPVLDRQVQPDEWLEAVYTPDAPLITQIADGAVRIEDGPTRSSGFTSSISCPLVVVSMLHHLDPEPGETILEIGTGTGYNTALLARRIGPGQLVTIENQPALAERAEQNLQALGGDQPLVVTGDGEQGYPERAPYDRILSTVGVRQVPPAWLHQVRAGGVIVTPIATPFGCDALAKLVCDGEGGASGRLIKQIYFMKLHGQRERRPWSELGWPRWPDYQVALSPDGTQRIRTV
ncbi:methyltransferase domain-containing protein [Streptomyces sp. NPDC050485]|uniref:methyltransferase domain-containing protein n=1 Tax=Streptomyces sp. NPDC050485 TaxID=3365617 RepID=UPI00379C0B7A